MGELKIIESLKPEDTFALGRKLGEGAEKGTVYTLIGDLGVGKTVFTQGLAAGLGIKEAVNSPTFTIVQIYEEGRLPFTILTYTVSEIFPKWMKSDMRTVFTEKASA